MDIYSRLLAGENMDDIMAEITAEANAAQARYNEELAREKEAAAKKAKQTAKREGMKELVNRAVVYVAEHYPSLGFTAEDLDDEELNLLADVLLMALDLEAMKGTALTKSENETKCELNVKTEPKNKSDLDEIFDNFFKTLRL